MADGKPDLTGHLDIGFGISTLVTAPQLIAGFRVVVVEPVEVDGEAVSSTRIRAAIDAQTELYSIYAAPNFSQAEAIRAHKTADQLADIAASGNRKLFRLHGRLVGDECRLLGFNVDFAPVVDGSTLPACPFHPDAPAISKSPKSRKYMYGLGLIARRPR